MKKQFVFCLVVVMTFCCTNALAQSKENSGKASSTRLNKDKDANDNTLRPRSFVVTWIDCYYAGGVMSFSSPVAISGMEVVISEESTGTEMGYYVSDISVALPVQLYSGAYYIVCITDDGTEYAGWLDVP